MEGRPTVRKTTYAHPAGVFNRDWLDEVWYLCCEAQPSRVDDPRDDFTEDEYAELRTMDIGTTAQDAARVICAME